MIMYMLYFLIGFIIIFPVVYYLHHIYEKNNYSYSIDTNRHIPTEQEKKFDNELDLLNNSYEFLKAQKSTFSLRDEDLHYFKKTNIWYTDAKRKEYLAGKIYERLELFSPYMESKNKFMVKYDEYKRKVVQLYKKYFPEDNNYAVEILSKKLLKINFYDTITLEIKKGTYLGYGETKYATSKYEYKIEEIYKLATDKKAKNNFMQEQRRLMSDNLRFEVLRRDHYRCCLCGATKQDGVKLEVDHILPVAKGGRTELNNLQTLCERCNRGKRDKVDEDFEGSINKRNSNSDINEITFMDLDI